MTLPRYNTMQRFWKKWPPMQILLAHYVGYKPPVPAEEVEDSEGDELDEESMNQLVQMFGPLPQRKPRGESNGEG